MWQPVILGITLLGVSSLSYAWQEINFAAKQRIEVILTKDSPNRLMVKPGMIVEVIGDESKYSLYWSSDRQNVFISPKAAVGETIELSVILSGNQVQDLRATIGGGVAESVMINLTKPTPLHKLGFEELQEVRRMLQAMLRQEKQKYYVMDNKRQLVNHTRFAKLKITQEVIYRYQKLIGVRLSVKNTGKESIRLKFHDFKTLFKQPLAIEINEAALLPKTSTKVFMVMEINDA